MTLIVIVVENIGLKMSTNYILIFYNQTRNRPVQGFGCRTGNSRKLNLNPVCRILPDRKQVFLTENFKLPDLAGNFNFLEYGYLFDRKFLSTKINFFILTQKTTSIITE